ncbi:biotin/lipoyl-binding protein, partial [Phenylobacterium conjunctum]
MFAFLRRHIVWVVVAVVALAAGGAVALNAQAKAKKAEAAKTAAAAAPKSPYVAIANGKADVEGGMIQVAARRAGIVREVLVSEGDRVVKGQILARQEDDEPRLAAAEAAEAVRQ